MVVDPCSAGWMGCWGDFYASVISYHERFFSQLSVFIVKTAIFLAVVECPW